MKKAVKNRASGAVSFLISCLAAIFAFSVAIMIAQNIGEITGGDTLLGYSRDSGILNFFGEPIELPKNAVNALLGFPAASAKFTLDFLPQTLRDLFSGTAAMLWESFCTLGGFIVDALVEFLRLGF